MAFDLPTQVGLDSDDPMADGEVGKIGVAVSSLQDLETVFDGIPLNKLRQISLVANAMSSIILAMFLALAEKQGVPVDECTLRIQNDVLKEFISRGAYIFPPEPSIRLTTDVVTYCAQNHPAWLPITLCGYHIREAGANAVQEVAYCLANGLAYMDEVKRRGAPMERVLPQLSAFCAVNMNFFEEIAKFRALRRLWARLVRRRLRGWPGGQPGAQPGELHRGQQPHRPAAHEQHRAGGGGVPGRSLGRLPVVVPLLHGRGVRHAHRGGGEGGAAHPADYRQRDRHRRHG